MKTVVCVFASILCFAAAQWQNINNNNNNNNIPNGAIAGYFIPKNATNNTNNNNNRLPYPAQQQINYGWNAPAANPQPQQHVAPQQHPQPAVMYPQAQPQAPTNRFDVLLGQCKVGDQLLFKTVVTKAVPWYGTKTSKDIIFPDPKSRTRIRNISCIKIIDNTHKGKGGTVQVTKGGIAKDKVELHIKSLPNYPIDMNVEVHGSS